MKLVTGGHGFIARNISADQYVSRSDCDLTNLPEVNKIFARNPIKTVIHCAAKIDSSLKMEIGHSDYFLNNVRSDLNVLEAGHANGIKNILMTGSISCLHNSPGETISEENLYTGGVVESNFGYNSSKRIMIETCRVFQLDYGLNYKVALLGNMYGPHDRFSEDGLIIGKLINAIDKAMVSNENVILGGNGYSERNFTYVQDLNTIFDSMVEDTNCTPVIVSCSEYYSIAEVAMKLKEIMNFKGKIIFQNSSKHDSSRKVVDNSLIMSRKYNVKWTGLKSGLEKTVEWFYRNRESDFT